jgi:hypothetical protein
MNVQRQGVGGRDEAGRFQCGDPANDLKLWWARQDSSLQADREK